MSTNSELRTMPTAAGWRLHTQAAWFRTGNCVMPAKHQLEAQIAQRHVQSHAAGKTQRHWQTDVRVRTIRITRHKGTSRKQQRHTKGLEEKCHAYKHSQARSYRQTRMQMHYMYMHWYTHIFVTTHYRYMHMAIKTLGAGLRTSGVSSKTVSLCLTSSVVFTPKSKTSF